MSDNPKCAEACRTPVDCTVCRMRKCPVGRDPGLEAASGYCNFECEGYRKDPRPAAPVAQRIDRRRTAEERG